LACHFRRGCLNLFSVADVLPVSAYGGCGLGGGVNWFFYLLFNSL